MGRIQLKSTKQVLSLVIPIIVLGTGVVGAITSQHTTQKAQITTTSSEVTGIKYHGIAGQNALDLLKKYAKVETKHYSFGDLVVSINGTEGNGPKYWSFYLNGKLADIGAGSYVTKNTDNIEWKLQSL